ncbi:hypothetical protein GCM10023147_32820 [Tsukamurella soli]|uniref:Secreted protein n=1 Tax=Tsukamurella soli TaxID=644556 RepID=A0ABP8JX32_9ACTN
MSTIVLPFSEPRVNVRPFWSVSTVASAAGVTGVSCVGAAAECDDMSMPGMFAGMESPADDEAGVGDALLQPATVSAAVAASTSAAAERRSRVFDMGFSSDCGIGFWITGQPVYDRNMAAVATAMTACIAPVRRWARSWACASW